MALANKNSSLTANTFYTEDIINTSEVTLFTSMQPSNPCSLTFASKPQKYNKSAFKETTYFGKFG